VEILGGLSLTDYSSISQHTFSSRPEIMALFSFRGAVLLSRSCAFVKEKISMQMNIRVRVYDKILFYFWILRGGTS